MTLYIAPIVEGQTEEKCVARLLYRVWQELLSQPTRLQVLKPFRGRRDALVHPNGVVLGQMVHKQFLKLHAKTKKEVDATSLLLILLDAEDDCPAELAPKLLRIAIDVCKDAQIACVLAKKMFENWIVAGCKTLAGKHRLPDDLQPPKNPEDYKGAAWLEAQIKRQDKKRKYRKPIDAEVFVQSMNVTTCLETAPSFAKLCRELQKCLPTVQDKGETPTDGGESEDPA